MKTTRSIISLPLVFSLFGTVFAAPEPLSERGLAAKYPGDEGIGKDPNVFVFSGFDSNSWREVFSGGRRETVDVIGEDGEWKFFSFNYRMAFMCPYEKGWVDEPVGASIAGSPENIPDKPTTYYMPYSRHRINVMEPPPPEPYDD